MNDTTEAVLHFLGVQGTLVAALVHLWVGVPLLAVYLPRLEFFDPRGYLFVPSALLLLVVVAGLYFDRAVRPLLALGVLVLLGYVAGYVWWHLGDHGGTVPGGHSHGSPVSLVVEHFVDDPLAFFTIVVELVGAGSLAGLLVGGYGRQSE
ncbi:hypothetical protein SAMN04487948_103483 [Halogranum amylolyticum]|uniref:Uncharacterized protein n=1 Tax=Halogranum amylolyticum TaxID=660520 RepID=A0A1H8R3S1_9EURY|nr:hypothetical protein [Halogranum amylolyticum]SEO61072.1 hypothetical protein SAMN04487948_103483 [Halogranum amylolyticum]